MTIRIRRLAGALAALTTLTGTAPAEDAATIACEIISTTGDFENLEPNFRASADRAEFTILAPMRAVADNILLYSEEQGGELTRGFAALRGVLLRDPAGGIDMDRMEVQWPYTVVKIEGQIYSIIQIAHDQSTPIGLVMGSGGNPLGDMELRPGAFDPNSPVLGFNQDTSRTIHAKLLENEGFSARLAAGGEVFSTIEPDTARYTAFITETLLPAMDEAKRQDAEAPCTSANPMDVLETIQF